jgi:hypothetical protein
VRSLSNRSAKWSASRRPRRAATSRGQERPPSRV